MSTLAEALPLFVCVPPPIGITFAGIDRRSEFVTFFDMATPGGCRLVDHAARKRQMQCRASFGHVLSIPGSAHW
jgi:hypothetical protein